jgi:membrane associated rhomboid family serine protease
MWFVWNLLGGVGQLGMDSEGGVAFFAHLGGFVAGMLLVRNLVKHRIERGHWSGWRPPERRAPARWGRSRGSWD